MAYAFIVEGAAHKEMWLSPFRDAPYTEINDDGAIPRRRGILVASGVLVTVAVAVVALRTPRPAGLATAAAEAAPRCVADGDGDYVTCTSPGRAFLAVPAVRDFFRARNVSDDDAAEQYLPAATTARFSPSRLRGDAADFRVAFALYLPEASRSVYASYLAVFRGDGTLLAAAPTDGLDDGPGSTHFDAVKLASATTVLAYSNVWDEEAGRPYVWDFSAGAAPEPLNELIAESSHDVQLAWGNDGGENDAYWSPAVWGVQKRRVRDGAALEKHSMEGCVDVNHAQLLQEDTLVLVSCRDSDSVLLWDLAAGAPVWVAGGANSTLKLIDEAGDAVESLWYGQHNAELFGESTLLLFDNAQGGPFPEISSVKRVAVDAAAGTATLAWSYSPVDGYPSAARFPAGYAEVFGDADLLPNGNVLATWWPRHLAPADGVAFDAQLVQITPDKDVAWSLDFSNTGRFVGACERIEDDGCERLVRAGWKVYSAEHFYDGPRASRATLDGSRLSFFAHAPFKRNAQAPGSWSLETAAGGVVASGELQFPAHFREAAFEVDAAPAVDGAPYVLAVADVDGHRFAVDVDVVS